MDRNKLSNQELTNYLGELEIIFENAKTDIENLNNLIDRIEVEYEETQKLLEKRLGLLKE